ncbi:MAG: adenosine kinase [Lentisphaeria bacterium]|nr:adenosine kinase [Lentisphaeria bacterium]
MSFKLLGAGSPLVDYSLKISDAALENIVPDGKGCTRNISHQEKDQVLCRGENICRSPGGSAANTIRAFSRLGGTAALFGKAGYDDDGKYFRKQLTISGADDSLLLETDSNGTGYCLSLITPDAERTMLSNLGASLDIAVEDIEKIRFSNFSFLLMEGYLACESWSIPLLQKAKKSGIPVALDLNNFELVRKKRELFNFLVNNYTDLLFANEEEIKALLDARNIDGIENKLPQLQAVIKLGKEGSLLVTPTTSNVIKIPPSPVEKLKDTTGAGDFYAAGFFFGMSRNLSGEKCCRLGALCASAIISVTGTELNDEQWNLLKNNINNEVNK